MKFAILAACLAFMLGMPLATGLDWTRSGPPTPDLSIWYHGGGGGP